MKFKQFIKDNIKRISTVILCIVLMFSMTITTLAFDGESISPIDKELLKEYIPSADVLYNSTGNPIYSPFNLDVLYWTMKIPVVNEGWECSKYEYFALTTGGFGEDISTTYYVVPERIASGLANWFVDFVRGDNGMPGVYNLGLINAKLSQSTTSSGYNYLSTSNTTWNFGSFQNESSLVDYSSFVKAYVYSVTRSAEGNILNVSELYYGFYTEIGEAKVLPNNQITQIYFHSNADHKFESYISNGLNNYNLLTYEGNVSAVNSNYYVSTSTYSITAYDFFDTTAIDTFTSSVFPNLTYSVPNTDFGVPECIRGPNFPSDTTTLSWKSTSVNYYLQEGFFSSDRAFLMFNTAAKSSSRTETYFIVFPEEVKTPILYAKFLYYGGGNYSQSFLQLISKVDYDIYGGSQLVGHFDAETTTFRCEYNASQWSYHYQDYGAFIMYFNTGGAYDNSDAYRMIVGEEYKVYPYLNYNMGVNYFRLNMYGNNAVLSLFPSSSGSLGFYSYVSPNIVDEVLGKGNTGESGGDIGGGPTGPDIFFDGDFFTELNNSEVFDLDLPPYPDASGIFDIDIADIWLIPERIVEYLILVIDWISSSFEIFINKVGGPIEKFFLIMKIIFENMPDIFRIGFILLIFTLLGLRLLQYGSSSINMVSGTVSSSYSRISRNKRKNKTKEKNKKGGDD